MAAVGTQGEAGSRYRWEILQAGGVWCPGGRQQAPGTGPIFKNRFPAPGRVSGTRNSELSPIRTEVVGKAHTWIFKFKK